MAAVSRRVSFGGTLTLGAGARRHLGRTMPSVLPFTLVAGLTAFGANSALLSSLFASACLLGGALSLQMFEARPLGRAIRPVALTCGAALIWALLGHAIVIGVGAPVGLFWPAFFSCCGAAAAFVAGAVLGHERHEARRALDTLNCLAIAWLSVSLVLYFSDPLHVLGEPKGFAGGRFTATLLNANTAGCLGAMFAVLGAGSCLDAEQRFAGGEENLVCTVRTMAIGAALLLLGLIAAVLSASRIAVMLCVMGLAVGALRVMVDRTRPTGVGCLIASGSGVIAAMTVLAAGRGVMRKISSFGQDAATRLADAAYYFDLSLNNPLFGRGLGSFRTVNLGSLDVGGNLSRWNYGSAHNAILHAAIEGGWPFALSATAAVALAIGSTVRRLRGAITAPMTTALLIAVAIGLLAGLVDIALDVPAVLALTAWFAGIAFGTSVAVSEKRRRRSRRSRQQA